MQASLTKEITDEADLNSLGIERTDQQNSHDSFWVIVVEQASRLFVAQARPKRLCNVPRPEIARRTSRSSSYF
jgi:hypothetical protein